MKRIAAFLGLWLLAPYFTMAQGFDEFNEKAVTELVNKNYSKAIEYSVEALNKKVNPRSYLIRAQCRYELGDFRAAIDDYNAGLDIYSDYYSTNELKSRVYYSLGLCKKFLGNCEEAIKDFTQALALSPDDIGALYQYRAECYYRAGQYIQADDDYRKALDRAADNNDLYKFWRSRGDCMRFMKIFKPADSFYTRALYYNRNAYEDYWNRGFCRESLYHSSKKLGEMFGGSESQDYFNDALSDFDKAISLLNDQIKTERKKDSSISYRFHYLSLLYGKKASLYADKNKYREALNELTLAINAANREPRTKLSTSNLPWAYEFRGNIYREMDDHARARDDYRRCLALLTDKNARSTISLNIVLQGKYLLDYKSCMEDIGRQLTADPENHLLYEQRAILYGYKKNPILSIKDYDNAIRYCPNDTARSEYYYQRAFQKERLKDYAGAIKDFYAYLAIHPDGYDTWYEIGRIYKVRMKNEDSAAVILQKAWQMSLDKGDTVNYAYCRTVAGSAEDALTVMDKYLKENPEPKLYHSWILHHISCMYAWIGNTKKALEYLDLSLASGFNNYNHLVNDSFFESLMLLPEWKNILTKYKVPSVRW